MPSHRDEFGTETTRSRPPLPHQLANDPGNPLPHTALERLRAIDKNPRSPSPLSPPPFSTIR